MAERFKVIPAVYLLLRNTDKILLLRRANTGYQDGRYSLIAGHLDGDELATTGVIREAKEEAGITIVESDLNFVHVAHRLTRGNIGQERIDLFFECSKWEGDIINNEPNKCDDLSWFALSDLPSETLPLIRTVLHNIAAGRSFSEHTVEPV